MGHGRRFQAPCSMICAPCSMPYSPKSRLNFCFNSFRIGFFCIIICSFSVSEKKVRSDSILSSLVVNSILEFLRVILNQEINSGLINLISSSWTELPILSKSLWSSMISGTVDNAEHRLGRSAIFSINSFQRLVS